MRRLLAVAFLAWLGFACSEVPVEPQRHPLVGTWVQDTTWTSSMGAAVKKGDTVVVDRFRVEKNFLWLLKLKPTQDFSSMQRITTRGWKQDGWRRNWEDVEWIVFRGRWTVVGNILRLEVTSREAKGNWGIWAGEEYTAVWKAEGDRLVLWWRDRSGGFGKESGATVLRRVAKEDDRYNDLLVPLLKPAGGSNC